MSNMYVLVLVFLLLVADKVVLPKTIDEIMFEATTLTSQFDHIIDKSGNVVKVEMDMLFKQEDWKEIMERNATDHCGNRRKRNAIREVRMRWTDNMIPYRMAPYAFTYAQKGVLQSAMAEWMRHTCIKFRPATSSDRNYVRFQNGQGCYSYVGMVGGEQEIGLATGCRVKGVVVHELGHAIGFQHEQTRPDRDNHVYIIHNNIPSNLRYNFQKYTWSVINSYGVPYDYRSIMHYGGKAFSMNGGLTIQTKDPAYQNVIGNRNGLSFRDIKLANLMYGCAAKENCQKKNCPGEGFVGKDCRCWCPGNPWRACEEVEKTTTRPVVTTQAPITTAPTECEDRHPSCGNLVTIGGCTNEYQSIMASYCRKSCNICGVVVPKCTDDQRYCKYWAGRGFCRHVEYKRYMETNCKLSCDFCDGRTGATISRDEYVDPCEEYSGSSQIRQHMAMLASTLAWACLVVRGML